FKDLLKKAGLLALGTDFPVEQVNPFLTFYAAVTRQDLEAYPEGGFTPSQLLSREEALKGMTTWAAYSNFEEEEKGSIEVGKFADFVLLDKDIMQIPGSEIPELQAVKVSVNGEWVK
ncbi:MAG: amidohydrolase family protein, partial [Flavobacteriaceae bacterium]|nr:amidohydrolase family protein [Flavobacteriaceae bacterium]